MFCLKMRCVLVCLGVLGVLSLYFSVCKLTPLKEQPLDLSKVKENNQVKRNFLQLPELSCEQSPPFLVLLVASAQKDFYERTAIRNTWGRERLVRGRRIQTLFLLGTGLNKSLQRKVTLESQQHGDIIQKDFMDVYYNLTLKTLMGMEWAHHFCPQAAFVMKTDTDTFVNVYYLTELLLQKNRTSRFFTGAIFTNSSTIRDERSKWFVSREEYPGDKYPPFCSGTGYVFSSDIAGLVYNVSQSIPFFKLEDIYVGFCLERLKITPEPLHTEPTFFPFPVYFSVQQFKKIVTCHPIRPSVMVSYWLALKKSMR